MKSNEAVKIGNEFIAALHKKLADNNIPSTIVPPREGTWEWATDKLELDDIPVVVSIEMRFSGYSYMSGRKLNSIGCEISTSLWELKLRNVKFYGGKKGLNVNKVFDSIIKFGDMLVIAMEHRDKSDGYFESVMNNVGWATDYKSNSQFNVGSTVVRRIGEGVSLSFTAGFHIPAEAVSELVDYIAELEARYPK